MRLVTVLANKSAFIGGLGLDWENDGLQGIGHNTPGLIKATEKIFPVNSPMIATIKKNHSTKVRRAKLFYLRKLRGKAARLKREYN